MGHSPVLPRMHRHRQLGNGMQVHAGIGIIHGLRLRNHGGLVLRSRPFEVITGALADLGCSVSRDEVGGLVVSGPAVPGKVALDLSKGSQPLSSLDRSAVYGRGYRGRDSGRASVSQRYLELTYAICKSTGSENEFSGHNVRIAPWDVTFQKK